MSQEILKRVEEIEARAARAMPGPWTYGESEREQWVEADGGLIVYLEHYSKPDLTVHEQARYDFDFIAHSREDVPWLCKLTRKLLAVAEAAQEALRWFEAFSYNDWGIAIQDDFADHELILKQLQATLAALEEVDDE